MRKKLFILEVLLAMILGAGTAIGQQISYSGSMQYATGSYFFEETTGSFLLSNGLSWSGERGGIAFSIPFILQNSPWISYGGAGFIPTGGPQHQALRDSTGNRPGRGGKGMQGNMKSKADGVDAVTQTQGKGGNAVPIPDTSSYTESSFGDPSIYANLKLYNSSSGMTSVQLNSGLKIPFANPSSGFGTGEWDFGVGVSGLQRVSNYFLFIDLMKWWFGNMPDLELKNPFTYSLGLSRSFGSGWMVNTTFSGYTEIIEDYDPPMTLGFGVGYFVSDRVSLNSSCSVGLSESSADQAFGLGWSIKI
ncbi:transporter [Aliifodinibius sp. S!AR15-10]|uniref:transporter n=1 Tax=Aliifodinibius sp. S!AR15-10 TaxID=2950437 RepID=UPI002866EA3A|nr:transporter [Aliifodinibius sp. S!AR15-10]MDR8393234.1 transporter [Aliifodinibius sp. S!AR15-10]